MKKIKIGQIGIGHNHGEGKMLAVRKFPELFEVIGYAEENEEWLKKRGQLACYKDLPRLSVKELLEKCDAVLVECDIVNLTKVAQLCVDAGKHVHIDKPASGTLEEFKKLVDSAQEKRLTLQMGYMYRYNYAIQKCMEMIKRGELGEIYQIDAEMSTYHSAEYRRWLSQFKGGSMYIFGSHLVDLVVHILGEPKRCVSFMKQTGFENVYADDNCFVVLEYEKAIARITNLSVEPNGWAMRRFAVMGSNGTVEIKPIEQDVNMRTTLIKNVKRHYFCDSSERVDVPDVPTEIRYDEMMKDFYFSIIGTKENPYSYEYEYTVQKVLSEIIDGVSFNGKILLKGSKIFNGERFLNGDILIENGNIVAIGQLEDREALIINCTDCIVSTGLIDIHTHFLEMGNRKFGFPADMATIPFGVTYAVDANLDIIDDLCVVTKVFIPLSVKGETLDFETMEQRLSLYGERVIGVKVYFDESLKNGTTKEHLRLACEFARGRNLRIMVHCSYSATPMLDIVELLNQGDILTHCYHGAYNTIDENDYIAYKKAKAKGVIIDAGMAGGVHTDFEILRLAIEKGYIPDTLSSDITKFSAYMRGGIFGLPMCMSIMKSLGMDETKIFQAVTVNAAKAVGQETWWNLQIGAKATLSVMKYDNVDIDITDRAGHRIQMKKGYVCKMTVKNGQILYRN